MSLRWFLAVVSLAAIVGSGIALLQPIKLDQVYQGSQISCGTTISPNLMTARDADSFTRMVAPMYGSEPSDHVGECQDVASGRRLWAIPLAAVGAVILLGALVVRTSSSRDNPQRKQRDAP